MSLTTEEIREIRMQAADAQRLLNDPTLWPVIHLIRAKASNATVYGPDASDREQGRSLVVAIDLLATELKDRMEAALNLAEAQRQARVFE